MSLFIPLRQTPLKPYLSQPDKRRLPPWKSHEDPLADGTRTKSMAQIILLGDQEKMDGCGDGFILLTQETQQAHLEAEIRLFIWILFLCKGSSRSRSRLG
ncbi:hypothetical protein Tco_0548675 [Tanacetum coccineum]